jgi:hypothetical protein
MNRNPNTPSATSRSAADEAAPAGGPKAGNSQEGAGASFVGWQPDSCPMADRWNFRLLV